jgi:hydroxymethylpyrimidine/phosphomethylpyrimidine kinase
VARQIELCASDIGCDAVKTGMLANAEIIDVVAAEISARRLGSLPLLPGTGKFVVKVSSLARSNPRPY